MKRAVMCFGLLFGLAALGVGQVRTVDNLTLQKYQKQRLAADQDYRDNYAKMGFPSPEELERQREADMTARLQLADQLRQARLEKEKLELQRQNLDFQAAVMEENRQAAQEANNQGYYGGYPGYYGGYGGGYYGNQFGFDRFGRRGLGGVGPLGTGFGFGGYRATPVGVYPNGYTGVPQRILINRGGRRNGGGGGGGNHGGGGRHGGGGGASRGGGMIRR